jgi:hypothetical protein
MGPKCRSRLILASTADTRLGYLMVSVTPPRLLAVPTLSMLWTGRTRTDIDRDQTVGTLATSSGAAPRIGFGVKPTDLNRHRQQGLGRMAPATCPSMPAGSVCPALVANTLTTDPCAAGLEGEFTVECRLRWPSRAPPESNLKIAGSAVTTDRGSRAIA